MTIKCIVIDDEPLAIEKIAAFIDRLPFLVLCKTFNNPIDALKHIETEETQLIFLDIEMGSMSGIDFLSAMNKHIPVILTTAYSQYAIKGYEFEVIDYLLKPFSFERFASAAKKAEQRISVASNQPANTKDFIFVKEGYLHKKVLLSEILYIEGMRDFRCIVGCNENVITSFTFKQLEEMLPQDMFMRVHKSYMVSLQKIDSVEKNRIRIGKTLIPVGESHKDTFYGKLEITK